MERRFDPLAAAEFVILSDAEVFAEIGLEVARDRLAGSGCSGDAPGRQSGSLQDPPGALSPLALRSRP